MKKTERTEEKNVIKTYLSDLSKEFKKFSNKPNKDINDIFKSLYEKEQAFAKQLKSTHLGKQTYREFIIQIRKMPGGVKAARSYFRIRQDMLLGTVNEAFNTTNPKLIFNIPINYRFCHLIINKVKFSNKPLLKLFKEIEDLRTEIIEKHLYLSFSRAKVQSKNSHNAYNELADLIQIANEALIIAVDKYVMDGDESTFYQMAIGRIISELIAKSGNVSPVSVGEHAKKKLYQIRKVLQKRTDLTAKQISDILEIAEDEVHALISSTVHKSVDEPISIDPDGDVRVIDRIVNADWELEYEKIEQNDILDKVKSLAVNLSILERKVLLLKGIKI